MTAEKPTSGKRASVNSRRIAVNTVLGVISITEIKKYLTDSANLPWSVTYPDYRPHFDRWMRRWGRLFMYRAEVDSQYDGPSLEEILNGDAVPEDKSEALEIGATTEQRQVPKEHLESFAVIVRTTLRRLWTEQDTRQRDWYCYRLRDVHRQMIRHLEGWHENTEWGSKNTPQRQLDYVLQQVPEVSSFEAAIYWLQINYTLMLHCANPLCEAPYFFKADNAKRQVHCSPECADLARRAAKLKWWNANRKKSRRQE